jgi:hypothetical protein
MRKLLCLAILLSASMAYAGDQRCIHLKIKIKNNTPFTCHLVDVQLKHGVIEDLNHLPLILHSGMESYPFDIRQDSVKYAPKTTLSYVCGDGHSITIQSKQTACIHYTKETSGTVVASENMDATFDTSDSDYFAGKAGEINWILN